MGIFVITILALHVFKYALSDPIKGSNFCLTSLWGMGRAYPQIRDLIPSNHSFIFILIWTRFIKMLHDSHH